MKAIVIASGGLDSTVVLLQAIADENITDIIALHFNYGSKHATMEGEALTKVLAALPIRVPRIDLVIDLSFTGSALIDPNQDIPKGHYEDDSMKSTVVPFRNGIMLSYAASLAESLGFDAVMYGGHAGDHTIYPDCRPAFVTSMDDAIEEGTDDKVRLYAPFIYMDKGKVLSIPDLDPKVLGLTYSCYEGGVKHCGLCGTCVERKEAFELSGMDDLTIYEEVVCN